MADEPPREAPVCFLLGAGSSVPADIPATVRFVAEYEAHLRGNSELGGAFAELKGLLQRWVESSDKPREPLDVELLLESLTLATNIHAHVAGAFFDTAQNPVLSNPALPRLLQNLRAFIRERCSVDPIRTAYWKPLLGFIQTYGRTHIFTTNYDLVMETFLESFGYPYTDGFDQGWNPALLDSGGGQTAVYKLHGSVNWYRSSTGDYFRLPIRNPPPTVRTYAGSEAEALMLYPAQKLEYSGPFLDMLGRFDGRLRRSYALVVIGYSFRDPLIVRIIAEALTANPSLIVILVSPSALETYQTRLAGIRVGRVDPVPIDEAAETSSLRGRVFPIPTTVENANGFLFSQTLPRLIEAINKEYEVREKELRFEPVEYDEVLANYLQAGFLDRCEVIEPRIGPDYSQSRRPLDYLAKKWSVEAAFRSLASAEVAWDGFLSALERWVSKYVYANATGANSMDMRFIVGEKPGAGSVHEGSDVANWWEESSDFAEDFAACAGPGDRQVWIMARVRQLRFMAPYFSTQRTANSNAREYFRLRACEAATLGSGLSDQFAAIGARWGEGRTQVVDAQEAATADAGFLLEVLGKVRDVSLTAGPNHRYHQRHPWFNRRPGPKVGPELQ